MSHHSFRTAGSAVCAAVVALAVPLGSSAASPTPNADPTTIEVEATNARFVKIEPTRAIDTRDAASQNAPGRSSDGRVDPSAPRGEFVLNLRDVVRAATSDPDADPAAVEVNLTVTDATGAGFLSAWAEGEWSGTSNINFVAGETRANSATVSLDDDGNAKLYANAGVHVVVDVLGYFEKPAGNKQGFIGGIPKRVYDTREPDVVSLTGGEPFALTITNVNTETEAVVVNLTTVGAAGPGYLTAYPTGSKRPGTSVLNYEGPAPVAGHAAIKTDENDSITLYSMVDTDVIVDVYALYADSNGDSSNPGNVGSGVVVATPTRLLDTRRHQGWNPSATLVTNIGLTERGALPPNVEQVFVTLTAIGNEDGYITAARDFVAPAEVSHVNYKAGQVRANTIPVEVFEDGSIDIYTHGSAHFIVDLVGYTVKAESPAS